jgi:DDE superfamily endonuclease
MERSDALHSFRRSLYECLYRRGDALFELTDAILSADAAVPSPVHLSLQASHRRGWGSLYAALGRGRIDAESLRRLLARHPLAESQTPVYAVDVSVWDRCDAECSPERGFYYHPSRHSAGQPIVAGWAYQFVAQLNFVRESWRAPVDVERVRPAQGANEVACRLVKVFFSKLHPKVQNHERKGSRGLLPIVVGTLILVEVERLPRGERRREPRVLWLWWHGPQGMAPDLDLIWRAYVRRFDLEHTFRFLKQSMGWTTPRVRHPEQADRWTWLMVAAFIQLRLARTRVADLRLPWERCYDPGRLTPVRVHRVVSSLLVEMGTPAKPPKPCGRSPGRPKGRLFGRAKRYPALKSGA